MRTYGSEEMHLILPWLMNLLKEGFSQRGVVTMSQCISSQTDMNRYDTGYQLEKAGVISGYDTTVKLR